MPRFQCPYHAWVYDLDGTLHKPRHTDMLENFDLDEWGLVPVALGTWQGFIFVNISGDGRAAANRSSTTCRTTSSATTWRGCGGPG